MRRAPEIAGRFGADLHALGIRQPAIVARDGVDDTSIGERLERGDRVLRAAFFQSGDPRGEERVGFVVGAHRDGDEEDRESTDQSEEKRASVPPHPPVSKPRMAPWARSPPIARRRDVRGLRREACPFALAQ